MVLGKSAAFVKCFNGLLRFSAKTLQGRTAVRRECGVGTAGKTGRNGGPARPGTLQAEGETAAVGREWAEAKVIDGLHRIALSIARWVSSPHVFPISSPRRLSASMGGPAPPARVLP